MKYQITALYHSDKPKGKELVEKAMGQLAMQLKAQAHECETRLMEEGSALPTVDAAKHCVIASGQHGLEALQSIEDVKSIWIGNAGPDLDAISVTPNFAV